MSVVTRCSGCGATSAPDEPLPPCRHFRRNRATPNGDRVPVALGPLEAFFVRRGLQPPWWPR